MKIAILGGAGQTGQCAVRALAESPEVSEGLVADLDGEAAREVCASHGRGKLSPSDLDVRDVDKTTRLIKGHDVVINAVQYYFNLEVMKAALAARANYLDFGGLYHTTLKQLGLSSEFESKGLVAVVGMGCQPGVTNVLARHAVDKLDTVESVRIRDGAIDLTKGIPPFIVTWSLDTFLDELTLDAPVFENGKTVEVPALSRRDMVDFPKPVGTVETFVTIHSEVATLPISFRHKGIQNVDWMEGVPNLHGLKLLVDLGMSSTEEVQVGDSKISPRRFLMGLVKSRGLLGFPKGSVPDDWETTRVSVHGTAKGKGVVWVYDVTIPPKPEWKMSCAQYGVGIPASIAARMIGRGDVQERGVLPAENCIDPARMIEELVGYGFKVEISSNS